MNQKPSNHPSHVLIFPFPAYSHVTTMLNLAELLCLLGMHVTFVNSEYMQNRLLHFYARFDQYAGFRFITITDGLPKDHPRCGSKVIDLFHSIKSTTAPILREMLVSGCFNTRSGQPITCIIADGVQSFAVDCAKEVGVKCILFRTISACCYWAYFCIPRLIDAEEIPFKENDMDLLVESIPGMEGILRKRDLPGFCRSVDATLQFVADETQQSSRADALILNTFEQLEAPILSLIRAKFPKVYTIGPLHAHLKSRLEAKSTCSSTRKGLNEEDKSCIHWLDNQPEKSTIYVSFGSIVVKSEDQLMELWHGLVNSGKRFLWVVKPNMMIQKPGENLIPDELLEATRERGYMVEWAPQEEVLSHKSIGGFLTHSGWNSISESMVCGVPMICWPSFGDQMINSRFVSEVWNIGLDMKDECSRKVIERKVRELMDERKEKFRGCAEKLARLARTSYESEIGSSYWNLDNLVNDLRNMSMPNS